MNDITFSELSAMLGAIVAFIGSVTYIRKLINTPFEAIDKRLICIENEIKSQKGAQLNLLRQSILKSCEDYLKIGKINSNQLEALYKSYDSYTALGGDSFITKLVQKCENLPLDE